MPSPEMGQERAVDVLLVSLASTEGLRRADQELKESLMRAGASVAVTRPEPPPEVPTLMGTDLLWARAARGAARAGLASLGAGRARTVIYSTTTAALLWPVPGAIRFDAPSAANRPGRHGLWQRPLERRRLQRAPLLLPWSEGGLLEAPPSARQGRDRVLVLPVPVDPSEPSHDGARRPGGEVRDIAAVTYATNPSKKGLDRVLAAWRLLRAERSSDRSEELLVAGVPEAQLERAGLIAAGGEEGIRVLGVLAPGDFRALLRRARVFACAPRREDYGITQLEALADGCQLVTSFAPGPYAALPIARELDRRLVGDDLLPALRAALEDPLPGYAERARASMAPFGREAVDRVVAEQLLPRLLP